VKWQSLVAEQEDSGESVAAFCRARGLRESLFYYRKKRLREAATAQFVEVQVAKPDLSQRHSRAALGSTIEVRLRNGCSLMVAPEFDTSHLRAVLAVVVPSLHTLDRAQTARIWLATEATDMRCGFDRLAERVRAATGQDPVSGHLFVFRSRRGDRLKILLWDRDGFLLWYSDWNLVSSSCRGSRKERAQWSCDRVSHGAGRH